MMWSSRAPVWYPSPIFGFSTSFSWRIISLLSHCLAIGRRVPPPGQIQHCLGLAIKEGPHLTQARLTGFRVSDGIIRVFPLEMPWWENTMQETTP